MHRNKILSDKLSMYEIYDKWLEDEDGIKKGICFMKFYEKITNEEIRHY